MLRDNLARLIEPMRAARELNPLALFTEQKKSSDDRPQDALKIPAPKGRNLTLTENAASPFHAEPRQSVVTLPGVALFSAKEGHRFFIFYILQAIYDVDHFPPRTNGPHRHSCSRQFLRGRSPPGPNHTRLQFEPCSTPSDSLRPYELYSVRIQSTPIRDFWGRIGRLRRATIRAQ